jgi:hypothetical protein
MQSLLFAATLLLASPVAGHGGVISYTADGVLYKGEAPSPIQTRRTQLQYDE